MGIGTQNRREISRALHDHRYSGITTYVAVNVPDLLKENP